VKHVVRRPLATNILRAALLVAVMGLGVIQLNIALTDAIIVIVGTLVVGFMIMYVSLADE